MISCADRSPSNASLGLFRFGQVAACKPASIWTNLLPASLLRSGQVYCLQTCFDWATLLLSIHSLRLGNMSVSIHKLRWVIQSPFSHKLRLGNTVPFDSQVRPLYCHATNTTEPATTVLHQPATTLQNTAEPSTTVLYMPKKECKRAA